MTQTTPKTLLTKIKSLDSEIVALSNRIEVLQKNLVNMQEHNNHLNQKYTSIEHQIKGYIEELEQIRAIHDTSQSQITK